MANILAAGLTAANSTDIVVTTSPVTVALFTAAGGALPSGVICQITKLNSSATYSSTGYILSTSPNSVTGETQSVRMLSSPGTYRVERPSLTGISSVGVGVDQD